MRVWNDIANRERQRSSRETLNIMEDYILENSDHVNEPPMDNINESSDNNPSQNELSNIM